MSSMFTLLISVPSSSLTAIISAVLHSCTNSHTATDSVTDKTHKQTLPAHLYKNADSQTQTEIHTETQRDADHCGRDVEQWYRRCEWTCRRTSLGRCKSQSFSAALQCSHYSLTYACIQAHRFCVHSTGLLITVS